MPHGTVRDMVARLKGWSLRNRHVMVGIVALLALIAAARHPSADIRILTHDAGDTAPHEVRAAVDLGIVAVSVLVTWTGRHIA